MSIDQIAIAESNLSLPNCQNIYRGKVRDVYDMGDHILMVASDRISAFDHILPKPIPYKGQILNGVATHFLRATSDIVPNWLEEVIDPNLAYGKKANPIRIEMVIRGYLAGHAWRQYRLGFRNLCGADMPEGLKEGDAFPKPIITPATKAEEGHDEDISPKEILHRNIVSPEAYRKLEEYTYKLFERGQDMAREQGLILVDTKYEFGMLEDGSIILIDEVHTPDSSRYYIREGYEERQARGAKQIQLSKEFVREWLMENGFQGKEGQSMPDMPDSFVWEVSERYQQLYEQITGKPFQPLTAETPPQERMQQAIDSFFNS